MPLNGDHYRKGASAYANEELERLRQQKTTTFADYCQNMEFPSLLHPSNRQKHLFQHRFNPQMETSHRHRRQTKK